MIRSMRARAAALVLLCASTYPSAHAGCSSAFCSLEGPGSLSGIGTGPRLDWRYEYIEQDQPRLRRDKLAVGEVRQHHDEIRTRNQNLLTRFEYGIGNRVAWVIEMPLVRRLHEHVHHHHGQRFFDSWEFAGLGDVRMSGRWRIAGSEHAMDSWVASAGIKFAAARFDRSNDHGDAAERSLQAGSGTQDALVGVAYYRTLDLRHRPTQSFAQVRAQLPLHSRDDFRPGDKVNVDAGLNYPLSQHLQALLQLNAQFSGRDRGREAEPEDTGGQAWWLSPGLGLRLGKQWHAYGIVQIPLLQRVNGVQLTANWALALGLGWQSGSYGQPVR